MRKILALVALLAAFAACPASAATVTGQCSIDKAVTVGSNTYAKCPISETENYLLSQGYVAARLEADVRLSQTPIYAHDLCRYTDARGLDTDPAVMVPFATAAEFQSFINSPPAHTDVVECCLPRGMIVKDVPEPAEQCFDNNGGEGQWILQSLVDPNDTTIVIARPEGTDPTSRILLVSGSENGDYPIQQLPIQRDNIDSVLPKGSKLSDYYVGRWLCSFGKKPVEYDPTKLPSKSSSLTASGKPVIGDLADVTFRLMCRSANWTPIPPRA